MTAASERKPPGSEAGAGAVIVRKVMRLVARRLADHAGIVTNTPATSLPDAVRHARAILVVALAEVGDMVLLSPFLHGLRLVSPDSHIALVCLPRARSLFEHSSDVDEVIAYDASMPRLLRPLLLPRRARAFARRELTRRFDVAIVPRWDTDHHLAAAVAAFSGAPRRVWHTEHANPRKATLNAGFDTLFTDIVSSRGVAHEVDRHLEMLRALGAVEIAPALHLELSAADRNRAASALATIGTAGPLIALGIGAAHPKRRWPSSRFVAVGQALGDAFGAHLVVVGGPDDVDAQADVLRALGAGATGFAGALSFGESAAVLERCRLFIGNDSAPMHLASAVGVQCVEISCHPADGDPLHNNAPERFAPWGVAHVVVRPDAPVPPCASSCTASVPHCILAVTPTSVIAAAESLLERSATTARRSALVDDRTTR